MSLPNPPEKTPPGSKILLAFSGGIDSAVAAHLCREAGFTTRAVHLLLRPETDDAVQRKRTMLEKTARTLGIKALEILDLRSEFREEIMRRCWKIFNAGKTPNPCVLCNPLFKFGRLAALAEKRSCEKIATGHYARLLERGGEKFLARGFDRTKDQSYFLAGLSRSQLENAFFPLGKMTKNSVREMALALGLPNAHAPESQDVCFASGNLPLAETLRLEFNEAPHRGDFIFEPEGKVCGRHAGIHLYTPGQRKGTGVALGRPAYVRKIDPENANILLTDEDSALFSDSLTAENINWQTPQIPEKTFRAFVQIRYRASAVPASVTPSSGGETALVRFEHPVRAVAPGQAAVFYDAENEIVLGGGVIR